MKKIIFLFFFFLFINNIYASNNVQQYPTDYYYNIYENGEWISKRFYFLTVNDMYAYCVEMNKPILNSSYLEGDILEFGLSVEELQIMELYAYYGFGYNNNFDIFNYMATQELIWSLLGKSVVWSTEINQGGDTFNLENYKNPILNKYYFHNVIPYLGGYDFQYKIGIENLLYSMNDSMEDYSLVYEGPNDIRMDNEKLIIRGHYVGFDSLILRKNNEKGKIRRYYNEGSQTLFTFYKLEYDYDNDININLRFYGNNLCFFRYDPLFDLYDDTFSGSLREAVYDIFDINYNYLRSIHTDYNGMSCMEGFSLGTYIVKEVTPSEGYYLNQNEMSFSIEFGETSKEVYLDAYRIYSNIEIHNYFENLIEQPIINFNLYKNDKHLYGFTNYNGISNLYLEYGEYCVKQATYLENYTNMEDFCFFVENNQPMYFYNYHNLIQEEDNITEEDDLEEENNPEDNITEEDDLEEENNPEDNITEDDNLEEENNAEDNPNDEEDTNNDEEVELDNKESLEEDNVIEEKNKGEKLPQLNSNKLFIFPFVLIVVLLCLKKKYS